MNGKQRNKVSWWVLMAIVLVGVVISPWTLKGMFTTDAPQYVLSAHGTVTNKRSDDYSCGKSGKYTCTEYVLTVNGTDHVVSSDVFNTSSLGKTVSLYTAKEVHHTYHWYELVLGICSVLSAIFALSYILVLLIGFIHWLLISDTDQPFFKWFNED